MDRPKSSYAQVRLFSRKKEEEKIQQSVFVNIQLEELIYLLDLMDSVYADVFANQSNCRLQQKEIATIYPLSFFPFNLGSCGKETYFSS